MNAIPLISQHSALIYHLSLFVFNTIWDAFLYLRSWVALLHPYCLASAFMKRLRNFLTAASDAVMDWLWLWLLWLYNFATADLGCSVSHVKLFICILECSSSKTLYKNSLLYATFVTFLNPVKKWRAEIIFPE